MKRTPIPTVICLTTLFSLQSFIYASGKNPSYTHHSKSINPYFTEVTMKKITSVLYVDKIEDCLKFWIEALGFEKTVEVREKEHLSFVILTAGNVEVMLQSFDSLRNDIPQVFNIIKGVLSMLYIEVEDIDDIQKRLIDHEIVVPLRKTFYGAHEIYYRSPSGHIIGFSQQISE